MESNTTTCVIDANTLIDHIHEVKALVYDGHIQLCVPLSSMSTYITKPLNAHISLVIDRVDQICRTSVEPKSEPEKAPRPKSGGKPARVYPTFDISPRVAKEFLERSKQDGSKLAVEFQKEEEQFTVWKNLEIKEENERQKNADGKPATFAAALLAKLNIAEAPAESPKGQYHLSDIAHSSRFWLGSVKPKLVAKGSGANNSPWKKPVPTITVEGVPSSLRPLLGYILWRLHERETYSFTKDSSLLISGDQETADVAKKLGVAIKSFPALRAEILARNEPEPDIATWGNLEQEFGVRAKPASPPRDVKSQPGENAFEGSDSKSLKPESPSPANSAEKVIKPEETPETLKEQENEQEKKQENIDTQEKKIGDKRSDLAQPEATYPEPAEKDKLAEKDKPEELNTKENMPVTPRAWADVVSNRTRPAQPKSPLPVPTTGLAQFTAPETGSDKSIVSLEDSVTQEKTSNILDWVQKVKANTIKDTEAQMSPPTHKKHRSRKSKEPTPPPEEPIKPFRPVLMQRPPNASQVGSENVSSLVASENLQSRITTSEKPPSPVQTPPIENGTCVGLTKHTPNVSVSSAQSASMKGPASEPLSTEAPPPEAPPTEASPPEAPAAHEPEDSDEEVVVFNPRSKRLSAQKQQASKKISPERQPVPHKHQPAQPPVEIPLIQQAQGPKPASPERTSQAKPRKQPKPRAPVVIDPDAFGRDFASNPRAHQHHQRVHSHSRGGFQQGPPQRPISQHGPPPHRQAPQQGPPLQRPASQHGPPRTQQRGGRVHQHGRVPLNAQPDMNETNGSTSNVQSEPNNADGYDPKVQSNVHGMNGNVSELQAGHNGQNGHLPSAENGHRNSQPYRPVNGSARNIPTREPTVETAGPDVDFVLKTGSTRASTRGRGRLWVP